MLSLIYLGHMCLMSSLRQGPCPPGLQIYPMAYHYVVGSQCILLNERIFSQLYPIVIEETEVQGATVASLKSQTV